MKNLLIPTVYYHIYNRGINGENIFRENRNYTYFLQLYITHIAPVVDTYAYCLLRNHFHLLVRIKDSPLGDEASQKFSNFFNAYAKAYNQTYQRSGALFQRPFKRKAVTENAYFLALIAYIHKNPEIHGFVENFSAWPFSSYSALISTEATRLERDCVLEWFRGRDALVEYHQHADEKKIHPLIVDMA